VASNSQSSCLSHLSAEITGVCHHAQLTVGLFKLVLYEFNGARGICFFEVWLGVPALRIVSNW
jgi:hypothetical protein